MKKFILLVALATTMATTTTELYSVTHFPVPKQYKGYDLRIYRNAGSFWGNLFYPEYNDVNEIVDRAKKTAKLYCKGHGYTKCRFTKLEHKINPVGVPNDYYWKLQDHVLNEIKNHVLVGDFKEKFVVKNDDNDKGDIVIIFNVSWKAEDEKNNNIQITTESFYVKDLQ